ncbi:13133_t:CDS:2 [Funneliformis mosseae]|uniref:13133_t:CDS:1 n=1 Tax=Funneliformis mosseae TaxID=27381 RepID=A0A9N9E993_FUNMO|nr:13133_t:CDS:2 [Funneliformis mosseae]
MEQSLNYTLPLPLYSKISEPASKHTFSQQKSTIKYFAIYGFFIVLIFITYVAISNSFIRNDINDIKLSLNKISDFKSNVNAKLFIDDNDWKVNAESDIEEFDWTEITS